MSGKWQSGAKIDVAKKLLFEFLDSLRNDTSIEMGLRIYGHQSKFPPQDCNDTKLEIPISKNSIYNIKKKLKNVEPSGTTPLAKSLMEAINDFGIIDNKSKNVIIIITDGIEECGGDPCAVSYELQKKGIFLKPFIVGIGEDMRSKFDCVGEYFDASKEANFKTILNIIISRVLNNTTFQLNLLDSYNKPTETNVTISMYDKKTNSNKYNFVHTLNNNGLPDTLYIDPYIRYRVVAHTLPPVVNDSVNITLGTHNIIPLLTPQGYFQVKMAGFNSGSIKCIIKKAGENEIINVQDINTKERYILGKYDVEVLTMPRIKLKDISILQNHTTTIDIPQPGIVSINWGTYGYGGIYYINDKGNLEMVYNISDNLTKITLLLQPGEYKIIFRTKNSTETKYTIEKNFKIESGQSIIVNIN